MQFFKQAAFPWFEDEFAAHIRRLTTEQGQKHHAPSHDRVDGDGAGQFGRALMLMGFDMTTAFQDAMPFFDTPTTSVPAQTTHRLFA